MIVFTQIWEISSAKLHSKPAKAGKQRRETKAVTAKAPGFHFDRDGHLCAEIPLALPMCPVLSPDCSNTGIYR